MKRLIFNLVFSHIFRPPRINARKYKVATLEEFAQMEEVEGVAIPKHEELTDELKIALCDWNNGNAGLTQAPFYFLLMRKRELLPFLDTFPSMAELAKAWLELPKLTKVQYRVLTKRPKRWRDSYGKWPSDKKVHYNH